MKTATPPARPSKLGPPSNELERLFGWIDEEPGYGALIIALFIR